MDGPVDFPPWQTMYWYFNRFNSTGLTDRDYERDPAVAENMIRWATIGMMVRRPTRGGRATRQQRRTWPSPPD